MGAFVEGASVGVADVGTYTGEFPGDLLYRNGHVIKLCLKVAPHRYQESRRPRLPRRPASCALNLLLHSSSLPSQSCDLVFLAFDD